MQSVQNIYRPGYPKSQPHHLVRQQVRPALASQLQRQLDNRITQLLMLRPLFADEAVNAHHQEHHRAQETTPRRRSRQPSFNHFPLVKGRLAAVILCQEGALLHRHPIRDIPMEQICPVVLRCRVPERIRNHRNQDAQHIVPRQRGGNG